MRNNSDIFCLKDPEGGQSADGMQMFSVGGHCPMRISRRSNTSNFRYGSTDSPVPSSSLLGDTTTPLDNEDSHRTNEDDQTEFLYSTTGDEELDELFNQKRYEESLNQAKCEDVPILTGSSEKLRQKVDKQGIKKSSPDFRKLKRVKNIKSNEQVNVTTSNISRNPLTGAGMEVDEPRKPKRGLGKNSKWLW